MIDLLQELVRSLPKNGEWKFEGQRERWIHAVSLMADFVMDDRKRANQRRLFSEEAAQITDIGPCGVVVLNGNGATK